MKSMVIVSHIPLGISLGWIGTLVGGHIFVVWKMAHPRMYALMNSVIPGHQYSLESNSIVFHWPGCPIKLLWNCWVTLHFSSSLFGTYINPL